MATRHSIGMQCLRSCGAVAVQGAVASQEERWDPSEGGRTGSCNKPATTISKVFPAIVRTARHVRRTCSGKSSSSSSPPVNRGPPPLKLSIILVLVRAPCSPLPISATLMVPAREAARSITACTELAPDGRTRTIVATTATSPHRWIRILVQNCLKPPSAAKIHNLFEKGCSGSPLPGICSRGSSRF
jgi:hypothetical protein